MDWFLYIKNLRPVMKELKIEISKNLLYSFKSEILHALQKNLKLFIFSQNINSGPLYKKI